MSELPNIFENAKVGDSVFTLQSGWRFIQDIDFGYENKGAFMDTNFQSIIAELSSKLGTTAEHLFGVMVKQAAISGYMSVFAGAGVLFAMIVLVKYALSKTTKPPVTEDNPFPRAEWCGDTAVVVWLCVMLVGAMSSIIFVNVVEDSITAFFNPEYWALNQLLSKINGAK